MKKSAWLALLVVSAVALLGLLRLREAPPQTGSDAESEIDPSARQSNVGGAVSTPSLQESDALLALRSAIRNRDPEAAGHSYQSLVQHIETHPGQVDEYLAMMRSEPNEWVLRFFMRAMAEAGAGLEDDSIVGAALELAKDSSFEQRQHIMLHFLAQTPELREDVLQGVLEISGQDPQSQVKTSAVAALADWMTSFPEHSEMLLDHVAGIFNSAVDADVRGFTYQLMALHNERLPEEMHFALAERLKMEGDSYSGNLIVSALSAAPEAVRSDALAHVQQAFEAETALEHQRNRLAQIVALSGAGAMPLLEKVAEGPAAMAQEARDYLAMLSEGDIEAKVIFLQKALRDATFDGAASCIGHLGHDAVVFSSEPSN